MKIAIDMREVTAQSTGPGIYASRLFDRLLRQGTDDEYVLFTDRDDAAFDVDDPRVRVRRLGRRLRSRRARQAWFDHVSLPSALRAERPDILFAPSFAAPSRSSCPFVIAIHDVIPLLMPEEFSWRQRLYHTRLLRRNALRARAVVTVSEHSRADIENHLSVPPERIHVIPNGVDPAFRPAAGDPLLPRLLDRLGIEGPYILFPGGILRRKNLSRALEAFFELRAARPSLAFLVTGRLENPGSRSFLNEVRSQIEERGPAHGVRFSGYLARDEMASIYRGARVVLYPSLYEGFGLPVSEGMASGVPVITSNNSSLREIAGRAALLVDPRSTEEILAAMRRAVDDDALRRELSARGVEHAARFRWESSARRLRDLFAALTGESAGALPGRPPAGLREAA